MHRSRSGKEARKHERISYECRIKMERQNLACKRVCLFFLFCKNANDTEMEQSGIEVDDLHGTHSVVRRIDILIF